MDSEDTIINGNGIKVFNNLEDKPRSKSQNSCTYMIAIMFSFFCTFSVFQVNLQSSRVATDQVISSTKPPADRVVIFLSDGTKADPFFGFDSNHTPWTPYLRSIIEEKGAFGVSYTSLPTESKICITSLLSGYTLDLPDLLKIFLLGKPVSDNLLNESRWAWSMGVPEIIDLFVPLRSDYENIDVLKMNFTNMDEVHDICPANVRTIDHLWNIFEASKKIKNLKRN